MSGHTGAAAALALLRLSARADRTDVGFRCMRGCGASVKVRGDTCGAGETHCRRAIAAHAAGEDCEDAPCGGCPGMPSAAAVLLGLNLARAARAALRRVLAAHGGAMAPAAASLGVTHLTLEALCTELGMKQPKRRAKGW